jgi:N-acetylmuramoyl-L-alanine amidase
VSRAPFALWRPIPVNYSPGGMEAYDGVVLHVMEGTIDGSDSWFRNPQAQASAHFGTGKDGRVYQWVDTADKAWAQAEGNPRNISIENEGNAGDALTAAQVERVAEILAWAHQVHGVPLRINDDPASQGLGWHGMGGAAWGGHVGCPGDRIKAQRLAIITRAQALLNPQPLPQPMPQPGPPVHYQEDNVTKMSFNVPTTDDQGNGNITLPGLAGRVVSVNVNGNDPNREGYNGIRPDFQKSDRGADCLLVIQGSKPHTGFDLEVWVAG